MCTRNEDLDLWPFFAWKTFFFSSEMLASHEPIEGALKGISATSFPVRTGISGVTSVLTIFSVASRVLFLGPVHTGIS